MCRILSLGGSSSIDINMYYSSENVNDKKDKEHCSICSI